MQLEPMYFLEKFQRQGQTVLFCLGVLMAYQLILGYLMPKLFS